MSSYFLDSSAAVKRYTVEIGSQWIFTLLRPSTGHVIFVARITGVEVVAALARKRKGQHLTVDEATKAINRFARHFTRRYQKITTTDEIIAAAMNHADKYALRGYDAAQLAAALAANKARIAIGATPLIFVSADNELNKAAHAEGLAVENPNDHP